MYLGAKDTRNAIAKVQIVVHEGDWRPSLAWMCRQYPEYFVPMEPKAWDHAGRLFFHFMAEEEIIKAMSERLLSWQSIHFTMPHYGLYVPDKEEWPNLITFEYPHIEGQIKVKNPDNPGTMVTVQKIKDYLAMLHKHGVASYMYFNIQHSFIDFALEKFKDSIVTKRDGSYYIGHVKDSLVIINSDPALPWGKHIEEQGRKLIETFPEIDGILVDCLGHWLIDFAHDDGITMIDKQAVYTLYLAYLPQLEQLRANARKHNIAFYGNGVYHIEEALFIDSIVTEGSMENGLPFLALKKPFAACLRDDKGLGHGMEKVCRACLKYGAIPEITPSEIVQETQRRIMDAYLPFFRKLIKREWELSSRAITFEGNLDGNIFRIDDNKWIATLIHSGESMFGDADANVADESDLTHDALFQTFTTVNTEGSHAVVLNLPKQSITRMTFMTNIREVEVQFEKQGDLLKVDIPSFRSAALLEIYADPSV